MNCTKRWSHLAEGNQPCVPRLVRAQSHSWGRKRAVQGLSGSPCLVDGKSAEKRAAVSHQHPTLMAAGMISSYSRRKEGRTGGKKEARVHSVITRAAF